MYPYGDRRSCIYLFSLKDSRAVKVRMKNSDDSFFNLSKALLLEKKGEDGQRQVAQQHYSPKRLKQTK